MTLQSESFLITTSITSFATTLEFGQAPVEIIDIGGGDQITFTPIFTGGSLSLTGSYTITGPNTTVSNDFAINSSDIVADDSVQGITIESETSPAASFGITQVDLPNSFNISQFDISFVNLANNTPLIFSEVVDGQTITNNLVILDFNIGVANTLVSVPEPSSCFLLILGGALTFKRRRSS